MARLYCKIGCLDFQALVKILFAVHLKCPSFSISADVKAMKNDLVHAMPGSACLLSLCVSLCTLGEYFSAVGTTQSDNSKQQQNPEGLFVHTKQPKSV